MLTACFWSRAPRNPRGSSRSFCSRGGDSSSPRWLQHASDVTLDPLPLVIVGDGAPKSSQVFLSDGEGALELAYLGLQGAVPLRELRYLHQ
jgi:hypothetical protein